MSSKGGSFEREVCKELSTWLNHGANDEGLWRTSSSGGRSTVRRKDGRRADAHAGDIVATTAEGVALLRHVCFELKTGYGRWSVQDDIDRTQPGKSKFAKFVEQAVRQCPSGKLPVLITRRLGGHAMMWTPERMHCTPLEDAPTIRVCLSTEGEWFGMTLSTFKTRITPERFMFLAMHSSSAIALPQAKANPLKRTRGV